MPESSTTYAASCLDFPAAKLQQKTKARQRLNCCGCSQVPNNGFETHQSRSFQIETGCCTHIGVRKITNEDSLFLTPKEIPTARLSNRGLLWAVADGIGGHNGGKIASTLACGALQDYYQRPLAEKGVPDKRILGRHLTDTVIRIDRLVRRKAAADKHLAHMGTTLSCLLLTSQHTIIAHVGDSRIYRWRRGRLTCLTTDHTFVQEMIAEGEVTPERARFHPLRNLLTHIVGTAEQLSYVQERIDPVNIGDRFLLCTDGLHHVVNDLNLKAILASETNAGKIARKLVNEALHREAKDDVIAVVIALRGDDGTNGNQSN